MLTIGFSLVAAIAGIAIAVWLLVRLPADYLQRDHVRNRPSPGGDGRTPLRDVFRNASGVLLVLVGALLSIPGVPGPGLIVVVAGLLLIDFPGKRHAVATLLTRPRVLPAINGLRRWFSQPPLDTADASVGHPSRQKRASDLDVAPPR